MRGHKICFYGKNLDNYPKIIPVIPAYRELVVVVVVFLFYVHGKHLRSCRDGQLT